MKNTKMQLKINYKALDLQFDEDYKGNPNQYMVKEFEFDNGIIEDIMDNIKIYISNLYMDKKIQVLNWKLICKQI